MEKSLSKEFLLECTNLFIKMTIFFSDPDEIPNHLLINFELKKNMEFFYKIVLIINSTYLTNMNLLGKEQE